MDPITNALTILASLAGSLALLGITAVNWGIDSRPSVGDDHLR